MKDKTLLKKRQKWYIVESSPALAGRQFWLLLCDSSSDCKQVKKKPKGENEHNIRLKYVPQRGKG